MSLKSNFLENKAKGNIIPQKDDIAFALRRRLHRHLRGVEHILNKDAVAGCGIIDHNVCHSSDKLAVL
jgi:hypothetical protein